MSSEYVARYNRAVTRLREGLKSANEAYTEAMKPYEGAEGSKLYQQKQKEAAERRDAAIQALRADEGHTMTYCLQGMLDNVHKRKQGIPTAESLRLLESLKMRENIDRETIEAASRTLAGDAAALEVLQDIALNSGIHGAVEARISNKECERVIRNLAQARNTLLKLDNALDDRKARSEAYLQLPVYGGNGLATDKFRVDRSFSNAMDCLSWHGCTTQPEKIAPILDGDEGD